MKKFFAILLAFAMLIPLALVTAAAQETTAATQAATDAASGDTTEVVKYLLLRYGTVILAAIALLGISNLVRKIKLAKQTKSQE